MDFLRSFMLLFAAFAMLLAVTPGTGVHAAGMEMGSTIVSAQNDADGCAKASLSDHKPDTHGGSDCAKMLCCLGTACVFAGLPAATVAHKSLPVAAMHVAIATTLLTGRDVAPPLDPPRSFV